MPPSTTTSTQNVNVKVGRQRRRRRQRQRQRSRQRQRQRSSLPPRDVIADALYSPVSPPVSSSSSLRLSSTALFARSNPLLQALSTSLGDLALTPRSTAAQLALLPRTNACSTSPA